MTWREYWLQRGPVIRQGLSDWRQTSRARVPLSQLRKQSKRKDLYSRMTVTTHGPSSNVGGKRQMLELGLILAKLLKPGETLHVRIVASDGGDYLDLS